MGKSTFLEESTECSLTFTFCVCLNPFSDLSVMVITLPHLSTKYSAPHFIDPAEGFFSILRFKGEKVFFLFFWGVGGGGVD